MKLLFKLGRHVPCVELKISFNHFYTKLIHYT